MRVIVTGGAGFIGSNLVDRLVNEGVETHVIDNLSTGERQFVNPKAKFHHIDILEFEKMRSIFEEVKPQIVFHLAAQVDIQTSIHKPTFDAQTNILGTVNILELCKIYQCKLIYSSSASVYGKPLYSPIGEQHPIKPFSNYGVSKYTPELYIHSYAKLYQLKYSILRYANVYGPRQMLKGEGGVIAVFINKMLNDESPTIFGDGQQTRDFIFVDDVVSANIAAMKTDRCETYNIGTCQRSSINEVFERINLILNKKIAPEIKPERLGDITNSCLDNELASIELQWYPKVPIIEGLTKTVHFYQAVQ